MQRVLHQSAGYQSRNQVSGIDAPKPGHWYRTTEVQHRCDRVVVNGNDTIEFGSDARLYEGLRCQSIRREVREHVGVDEAPACLGKNLTEWARHGDEAALTRQWTGIRESIRVTAADHCQE